MATGIKFGNRDIVSVKYCDPQGLVKNVSQISRNGTQTWPPTNYLTFTARQAGSTVTFGYANGSDIQYRMNGGEWLACPYNNVVTLANIGDKVQFRGTDVTFNSYAHFSMSGSLDGSGSVTSMTDRCGADPDVTLTSNCYVGMFKGCSALVTPPELPALKMASYCYNMMFYGCSGLVTPPVLPSTQLAEECYTYMFWNCPSLSTVPALPATTLATGCYHGMFRNCRIETAPELPAETLAEDCYYYMFAGCTALKASPRLPARVLPDSCYLRMFEGGTSMEEVTTLQSSFDGCWNWLSGAKASGTIHCTQALKDAIDAEGRGAGTIPAGWTVVVDQV